MFDFIILVFESKKVNKMAQYGYDKQRFPNLTGDMFDCPICTNVVRSPKECSGCGDLFCGNCIDDWKKKTNNCPKRCNGSNIKPMASMALIRIYKDLDIKCSFCNLVFKLADIDKHETNCRRVKCLYNDICAGYEEKEFNNCCSYKCRLLNEIQKTGGNPKLMYDILVKIQPRQQARSHSTSINKTSAVIPSPVIDTLSGGLKWNQQNCGQGLQFENGGALVMLKQPAYVFRTSTGTIGFNSGQHYWEIIPDSRTENELKIGVTTTLAFDLNTAFCDHVFGFAYYGLGQLRYNSNASGPQYGKRLKKQGVLGVFLNMDKGQLSFSLNGESMGVAFDNAALKKGPIYPAVALLHCAGCSIRGELPIPSCFK